MDSEVTPPTVAPITKTQHRVYPGKQITIALSFIGAGVSAAAAIAYHDEGNLRFMLIYILISIMSCFTGFMTISSLIEKLSKK